MQVYLSPAIGPADGPVPTRLRAVGAVCGIQVVTTDRTQTIAQRTRQIRQSSALVALVTTGADPDAAREVQHELHAATAAGVPVIALVEVGVVVEGLDEPDVVRFDRLDPHSHEAALVRALERYRPSAPAPEDQGASGEAAVGWLAVTALALVALGAAASAAKPRRHARPASAGRRHD